MIRRILLYVMGVFYVLAGYNHFADPDVYRAMIPGDLPIEGLLHYGVGTLEIVLGVAVLIPRYRVRAAWGLIALLIAIFPANVYVAIADVEYLGRPTTTLNWIRLPFQFLFIAWAWWYTKPTADQDLASSISE